MRQISRSKGSLSLRLQRREPRTEVVSQARPTRPQHEWYSITYSQYHKLHNTESTSCQVWNTTRLMWGLIGGICPPNDYYSISRLVRLLLQVTTTVLHTGMRQIKGLVDLIFHSQDLECTQCVPPTKPWYWNAHNVFHPLSSGAGVHTIACTCPTLLSGTRTWMPDWFYTEHIFLVFGQSKWMMQTVKGDKRSQMWEGEVKYYSQRDSTSRSWTFLH